MISANQPKGIGICPETAQGFRKSLRELVQTLERARSRLAVAAAADAKVTPLMRRVAYLETEDRIRRCLKDLRSRQYADGSLVLSLAIRFVERMTATLERKARRGEASELHQLLQEVLAPLEQLHRSVEGVLPPEAKSEPSQRRTAESER